MTTAEMERVAAFGRVENDQLPNGPAWAALLSAGIGAFATGLIVVLNEIGLFTAPALYAPAGGVSGRTTFAVLIWLVAWAVLHARWKEREIDSVRVASATLLFVVLGIVGTFPPLWSLL
ncbi:MAG TPA: hypothetical protein VMM18_00420 [Gemmatimonadaceae bacterium]|nr:hypothetical protein [Gemmatimonadaceae bacterium]